MDREPPLNRVRRNTAKALTNEQVYEARRLRRQGWTMEAIAAHYNVTRVTIRFALYALKAYKNV